MALLRDTRTGPPGGWRYVQLETGCEIIADSDDLLVDAVIRHRIYKAIGPTDRPTVTLEVHRQICSGLGEPFCRAEPGEDYRPVQDQSRHLTLMKIMAFSDTAVQFVKSGGQLIDKDEAKARGDICRGCRFNTPASACSCSTFYRLVNSLIPEDRRQLRLGVCGACGCTLQAKVNLPAETVRASNRARDLVFPPYCWQRET